MKLETKNVTKNHLQVYPFYEEQPNLWFHVAEKPPDNITF